MKSVTVEKAMVLALVAIVLSFATIAPAEGSNLAHAQYESEGTNIDNCSYEVIREQTDAVYKRIDETKAKATSRNNEVFKEMDTNYTLDFLSLSTTWTADTITCEVTLDGIHLAYSLTDNDGKFVRNIMVNQDKDANAVNSIEEQPVLHHATSVDTINYSGYHFHANSAASTPVYIGKTTYTIRAISTPTSPSSGTCTSSVYCAISVWTGISDAPGTSNNLAQAGTTALRVGTTNQYVAWYEFLPANAVLGPGSFPVVPGNPMEVRVINNAYNGGSSSGYEIYMKTTDGGVNKFWIVTGLSYPALTSPKYAMYVVERPQVNGVYATIGKFTSFSMTGELWYSGSYKGISTPYGTGYYQKDTMKNWSGGTLYTNVSPGSVSSSAFTQTYVSSTGT